MRVLRGTLCFLIMFAYFGHAQTSDHNQLGKITFSIGHYYIQNAGELNWEQAEFQAPVYKKDKVRTEKEARCEVTFSTQKIMRIGENSIVQITKSDAGEEEVQMNSGRAWLSLFSPKKKKSFRLKTPTSICAVRGTVFRLESDSNATSYRCYDGELAVTPFENDGDISDSTFSVKAGEELILVMDFEEYKRQQEKAYQDYIDQDQDAFERFKQQDQQQFEEMVQSDFEAFEAFRTINYKQSQFDLEADMKSSWVQWNRERDKLVDKQ